MDVSTLHGLLETVPPALGEPGLLGETSHALCPVLTQTLENPHAFVPKSPVGLVRQKVAELSPACSSSASMTDTQLSRLKRIPAFRIKNQLHFYLAISRLVAAVPPNHLLHILTILV